MDDYKNILDELRQRNLLSDDVLYESMRERILALNKDNILRLKRQYQSLKDEKYRSEQDWERLKDMVIATLGNPSS